MNTTIDKVLLLAKTAGFYPNIDLSKVDVTEQDTYLRLAVFYEITVAQALLSQGEPVGEIRWRNGESFVKWAKGYFPEAGTKLFTAPHSTEALQKDNAELFGKTEQLNKDKAELTKDLQIQLDIAHEYYKNVVYLSNQKDTLTMINAELIEYANKLLAAHCEISNETVKMLKAKFISADAMILPKPKCMEE